MDLDTTVKNLQLSSENLKKVLTEIGQIDLNDGFSFEIEKIEQIRHEEIYPGIRVHMKAYFDKTRQPLKLDVTTADIITPHEIDYELSSLFSDPITVKAYPLETILAEKLETIISRDIANTRLRDFYDVGILFETQGENIDYNTLFQALKNTATKRGTLTTLNDYSAIISKIKDDAVMQQLWLNYADSFPYAQKYTFDGLCDTAARLFENVFTEEQKIDSVSSLINDASDRSEQTVSQGDSKGNKDYNLV